MNYFYLRCKPEVKMKQAYKLIFVSFFIIFLIGFISGEETSETVAPEKKDYAKEHNLDYQAEGKNMETKEDGSKLRFEFKSTESEFTLKGKTFKNIDSSTEKPGHISIDKTSGDIIDAQLKVTADGGKYEIANNEIDAPGGSQITYDKNKKEIHFDLPSGSTLEKYPKATEKNDVTTKMTGNEINLPDDNKLNAGTLNFKNNEMFVERNVDDKKTHINDIQINPQGVDQTKNLFLTFNEKDVQQYQTQNKDYLHLGKGELSISARDGTSLAFNKKSPYFHLEEGDTLEFHVGDGRNDKNSIQINDRYEQGLVPFVKAKGAGSIRNGGITIDNRNAYRSEITTSYNPRSTSSPMEIALFDSYDRPLSAEPYQGHNFVIDNSNRFAVIPNDKTDFIAKSEGIDAQFSRRIGGNYVTEQALEKIIGKDVTFSNGITQGEKNSMLGRMKDYWGTLTREQKDAIGIINLNKEWSSKETRGIGGLDKDVAGYASTTDNSINFLSKNFDYETFRHEAAHTLHFDTNSIFNQRWNSLAGSYNKVEEKEGMYWYNKGKETDNYIQNGAALGYTCAYGGKNHKEDVATFVEKAGQPEFFKPLLQKDNPNHDIYREKLRLLREYRFLSNKEYTAILDAADVK